jgi:predicted amidohydrolase
MEDKEVRVAVVQLEAINYDIDTNLKKHLHYIEEAKKEKADIVLFPEYSLTGTHLVDDFLGLAMPRNDKCIQQIKNASKGITAMFGFAEVGYAAQFYNSCMTVEYGKPDFIHRKMNLCNYGYWNESKYFAQGRYLECFKLKSHFTGCTLICNDMWNPALVHLATLHGATILFSPIASGLEAVGKDFSNPNSWMTTIKFYSMMYGMPVVLSNLVGKSEDMTYWGGSCIIDPYGNVLSQMGETEGMIIEELDYNDVKKARFRLPVVRDSNFSLIKREMDRIGDQLGIPIGVRDEDHGFEGHI